MSEKDKKPQPQSTPKPEVSIEKDKGWSNLREGKEHIINRGEKGTSKIPVFETPPMPKEPPKDKK